MTRKRIAITGATGFLGRHVVKAVYDAGHIPVAVVRDTLSARANLVPNTEVREADITDLDALTSAFENVHMAIHLAGMVSLNKCDKDHLYNINVTGSKNFITAAEKTNLSRAIFTSTTSAVGALKENNPDNALNEKSLFNLNDQDVSYIKTKREAHVLALNAQENDQPIVIMSPSLVLGPDDKNLNTSALIDAIKKRTLPVCPNGGINPIDVRDVAKAYVEVINHPMPSRHYILASEQNISLKTFTKYVAELCCVPAPLLSLPSPIIKAAASITEMLFPHGILTTDGAILGEFYWYFDAALARRELSLSCRPLDETIHATLAWLSHQVKTEKQQNILERA
ncbi:MAG: NAD-dependent epimerase/dehydratase family protein [Kordiimonadaceae bacterium]|jgi:dihydroflavonol-4-reductase|nr:NAD-dependent epimerase/dehydratase family protein [Kordiimonadaceae bacterium]MBT6328640.1 NAD-dependent epimerase/dehydratase family protein [Kordiimonadaceae bacterium]MBT7583739.1 NAD-dependent epimerase/dehydratase family protein [Kordiimonadaceae bacterium]